MSITERFHYAFTRPVYSTHQRRNRARSILTSTTRCLGTYKYSHILRALLNALLMKTTTLSAVPDSYMHETQFNMTQSQAIPSASHTSVSTIPLYDILATGVFPLQSWYGTQQAAMYDIHPLQYQPMTHLSAIAPDTSPFV